MPVYSGKCHTQACGKVKHNIKVEYAMEDGDVFGHAFCECGGVLVKLPDDSAVKVELNKDGNTPF